MVMDLESVFLLCAYLWSIIACQFSLTIIREYHKRKPLGMQTLLSEVTVIYANVFGVTNISMVPALCLADLFAPFPRSGNGNKLVKLNVDFYIFIDLAAQNFLFTFNTCFHCLNAQWALCGARLNCTSWFCSTVQQWLWFWQNTFPSFMDHSLHYLMREYCSEKWNFVW